MSYDPWGNDDTVVLLTGLISLLVYILPYVIFLITLPKSKNDKLSLQERIKMHSDQSVSSIFFKLEVVNAAYSLSSCILFVWDTYLTDGTPIWMFCLELSFSVFFMYNFLFLFYLARKKFPFLLEPLSIVDEVTVIPVLFQWFLRSYLPGNSTNSTVIIAFLKIVKMLRVFRLMRIFRSINSLVSEIDDAINTQVTLLISTLISIIVITTGFVQVIGNLEVDDWCSDCDRLEFHDALYFTVVTFSTVGYGDISPGGNFGRIMIVCVICGSIYIVPRQIERLNRLMEMRSKYAGAFIPKADKMHVVVGCSPECHGIIQFLNEFFHEDHGTQNAQVVVVVPDEPDLYWREAILKFSSKERLTYLKGDLKNLFDCQRAKIETAAACFLLVDRNASDPHRQDSLNFMRSLAVLNYHPSMRLFVQLLEKENKQHLITIGIRPNNIICVKEFKMGLIAQSCIVRGFSAMLGNMVASSSIDPTMYAHPWHHEYCTGMGKEIYSFPIGEIYTDDLFKDAVKEIYNLHSAILFAISCGDTAIANPGSTYKITAVDKGFILADDFSVVEDVMQSKSKKLGGKQQEKNIQSTLSNMVPAPVKRRFSRCESNGALVNNPLLQDQKGEGNVQDIVEQASYITRDKSERKVSIIEGLQAFHQCPESLKGHYVIITDTLEDTEHLVAQLRKPHLVYRSVLIMCPLSEENTVRDEISWAALTDFGDCYLLQGHPRNDGDLDRALVQEANTVIIVAGQQKGFSGDGSTSMDAETILAVVSIIARSNGKVRVISELNTGDHVEHYGVAQRQSLLNTRIREVSKASILKKIEAENEHKKRQSRPTNPAHELHEVYASGGIVLGNLTETLLCQAYFNDYIVSVVGSFLQNHMDKEGADGSSIAQIPVPQPFFRMDRKGTKPNFEELMSYMLDTHDVLVIALYRNKHHAKWSIGDENRRPSKIPFLSSPSSKKQAVTPEERRQSMNDDQSVVASYVVTCPLKETEVTENDLIFVFVKDLATYNAVTAGASTHSSHTRGVAPTRFPKSMEVSPKNEQRRKSEQKRLRGFSSRDEESLSESSTQKITLNQLPLPITPDTLMRNAKKSQRNMLNLKNKLSKQASGSSGPEHDSEKQFSLDKERNLELASCSDGDDPSPQSSRSITPIKTRGRKKQSVDFKKLASQDLDEYIDAAHQEFSRTNSRNQETKFV